MRPELRLLSTGFIALIFIGLCACSSNTENNSNNNVNPATDEIDTLAGQKILGAKLVERSNGKNVISHQMDSLRDLGVVPIEERVQLTSDSILNKTPTKREEIKRLLEANNAYGREYDSLNLIFDERHKYLLQILDAQILLSGETDPHSMNQNSYNKSNEDFIIKAKQ